MRILMLTPYLPYPPSSGGQVRSYNLIKHLSKSHEITLVSLIKHDREKKYLSELQKYCKFVYPCKRSENPWTLSNILRSIFGKYPFIIVRNFSKEAQTTIQTLLKNNQYDIIHAETFYVMPHIPSRTEIPVLLVEQTIEYKVYQHFVKSLNIFLARYFFYYDIAKLIYWEKFYWKKATRVVVVSESDKQKIKSIMPKLKVNIIPNGAGEELLSNFSLFKRVSKPVLLYVGNFSWLQNIEAAKKLATNIFPPIKKAVPEISCIIAGQMAYSKLSFITKDPSIKIVELKPHDTKEVIRLYKNATIFIAPISGPGGTRLKVLAAMASGLPVISSPVGIEGLSVIDNVHALIAKSDSDYPILVKKILQDKSLYSSIRLHARKLIVEKYSYNTISISLSSLYQELSEKK